MSSNDLLGTAQVAARLGITPRAVARRVERGSLTPVIKLPGRTGALLFDRQSVEAIAPDETATDER